MYGVFDHDRPASELGLRCIRGKGTGFTQHEWPSLKEVKEYAAKWMAHWGIYGDVPDVDRPINYGPDGQMLEVRIIYD